MSKQNRHRPAKSNSSSWIVPAVLAVCMAGVIYWAMNQSAAPAPATASSAAGAPSESGPVANMVPDFTGDTIPAHFESAAAAQPYPKTLPPEQFPNPVIMHAYTVAKQIPGVLAQQPCYCHCDMTAGHRGLLDCYADLHGSSCSVCVQEALLTEKLTKEGRSPSQIREAIIRGDWRTVELN